MLGLKEESMRKCAVRVFSADKPDSGMKRILLHYDSDTLEALQKKPFHSKEERAEIAALASCRGIIIDLTTMKIIKKSFCQTVNIPAAFVPLDMNFPINTSEGEIIPEWGIYRTFYGGTLIHSYWFEGKTYLSSFKQIDVTNSRFGDSKTFMQIFLDDQNVFESVDDLYPPGSDKNVVHIFILNNNKLLIDTRVPCQDKVVYIRSLCLEDNSRHVDISDLIRDRNASVTKPMVLGEILTPLQVNRRLRGNKIDVSDDYDGDHNELFTKYVKFLGGERVIYESSVGICTLVPPSCKYRQDIMQGKNNIQKLFTDCMADPNNTRNLSKITFSYDDCVKMIELIERDETIYIDKFEDIYTEGGDKQLQVLTNLILTVPICRVREVLEAYKNFSLMLTRAVEHIFEQYDELCSYICLDSLQTYPGVTSVKFRNYLCDNIVDLSEESLSIDNQWPSFIQKIYSDYYALKCKGEGNIKDLDLKMNITAIIGDSTDDVMYTFLTFPDKYQKAKAAMEKRAATASTA